VGTGLGQLHDESCTRRVRQLLAVVTGASVDDFGFSVDQRRLLRQLGDDNVGLSQKIGRPYRQQTRIPGSGSHETDASLRGARSG
jgi:hypothetical protein